MTLKEMLEILNESVELSTANELRQALQLIQKVQEMGIAERQTLKSIWAEGPLHDGLVLSKDARDRLIQWGFVARVVVKGVQGHNACTNVGHSAYLLINSGI